MWDKNKPSWYNNIEQGVRDLVFILRNNGFNTECSCEHEKYIQCQYILDGDFKRLHELLYNYYYDNDLPCNYRIELSITVKDGHSYSSLIVYLE